MKAYQLKLAFQRLKGCDLDLERAVLSCCRTESTRPLCQEVKAAWFYNRNHAEAFVCLRSGTVTKADLLYRKIGVTTHNGKISSEKCAELINRLRLIFLRRRTQQLAEWLWERSPCEPEEFLKYMEKGAERLRKEMNSNGVESEQRQA